MRLRAENADWQEPLERWGSVGRLKSNLRSQSAGQAKLGWRSLSAYLLRAHLRASGLRASDAISDASTPACARSNSLRSTFETASANAL